jgi:glycerol uptake facilitator-like aquaporin
MLGVYVSGGISGGHLNPAVTLAFSVTNKFPWKKVLPYFLGQYLGAFFASVVVYFVYWGKIKYFLRLSELWMLSFFPSSEF